LIHIHSPDGAFLSTILFILLARLARTNMLVHMHGTDWEEFYTRRSAFNRSYTWIGLRIARRIVVLYPLWAENIRKICPTADVLVVRNLIHDQDPPQPAEVQQLKEQLGLTEEHFVVITIGYVGWRKGSFVILNAVPQVASQDPSVRFVLVGSEEFSGEMAQLTQRVDKENLAAWVTFTGELERSKANLFYSLADVYLLPSFIEGMPITIIEALRSGLPVISTRVGGIPDMIEDHVSGLLLDPGAPNEIAEAVLLLRNDQQLRKKLAEGARRTFEDKFEFSRGIEEIRAAYRSFEK
jgi:glycosyltransferase involved in cell wall biosynthesis